MVGAAIAQTDAGAVRKLSPCFIRHAMRKMGDGLPLAAGFIVFVLDVLKHSP
jgi:hypothetical protein